MRRRGFKLQRIAYQPGDSWLHQRQPLLKLAWLTLLTIVVFAQQSPWITTLVLLLLAAVFPLSGLSLRNVRGRKLFGFTALLMLALQALFVQEGHVLFSAGPFSVTLEGLEAGIYVAVRLWCVLLSSHLFVYTTEPNDLAYALMQAGVPYRYGFTLVTALRLIPVFEQEGDTIYKAQLARGIAYDHGGPRRFLKLARQYFLPLLVSALSKVDALAVSMEGRCFGKYPQRTFVRQVRFTHQDGIAAGVTLACVTAWIAISLLVR